MEPLRAAWYNTAIRRSDIDALQTVASTEFVTMTKPHKKLKKANHGSRPANSKARKAKRKHIRT
ncbi:MAG: hypothetical protein WCQ77_05500 [Planctomycetota bacterium]